MITPNSNQQENKTKRTRQLEDLVFLEGHRMIFTSSRFCPLAVNSTLQFSMAFGMSFMN